MRGTPHGGGDSTCPLSSGVWGGGTPCTSTAGGGLQLTALPGGSRLPGVGMGAGASQILLSPFSFPEALFLGLFLVHYMQTSCFLAPGKPAY